MCPLEFATGIKPDLSKLRIFGCIAYAFIDPSRRVGKLADRAKPYIYVGNDDESNGYLIYNRTTHETTTQGIVQFVEIVDVYLTPLNRDLPRTRAGSYVTLRSDRAKFLHDTSSYGYIDGPPTLSGGSGRAMRDS